MQRFGTYQHLAAAMRQAERENDTEFIKEHGDKFSISVPETQQLYVTAYLRLDSEREYLSNIPWSKIILYAQVYRLTVDQTEWLIEVIERVDNAILKHRQKEVNKGGKS